ncbi:hypothetical protein IWW39_005508 [Coemansia spiralis]|uniref:Uncharacterized protein n=1 Tax=Coemansia spiralis TaxID=417178 RepID=A0A9W8GHH2_9FUNG|nr:hypothetical protein IWW39_005508 [Coemansia spiralis]
MKVPERVSVVKVLLTAVGFKRKYQSMLEKLVIDGHFLTMQIFQFARWIILNETANNFTFDPGYFLHESLKQNTRYDELVTNHFHAYCAAADAAKKACGTMTPIAVHVARAAVTNCTVNIAKNFSTYLHCAINKAPFLDEHCKTLRARMAGKIKAEINAACNREVWAPARVLRQAIQSRPMKFDELDNYSLRAYLRAVGGREVPKEASKWSITKRKRSNRRRTKARHRALYEAELALLIPAHPEHPTALLPKTYQYCPLRTWFVAGHVHINTETLYLHFLIARSEELNVSGGSSMEELWGKVFDIRSKPFKPCEGPEKYVGFV